ncbi:MAG: hypothetical protein ABI310_01165 [Microbacteriaceae bacterium]
MTTSDLASRGTAHAPIVLGPNQPENRPYRGGAGIARFRNAASSSAFVPEDFVASTTEVHAGGGVGFTILPDGTSLRDAVAADPVGFLGEDHVRAFGAHTMLLVKLLDTAERLFVHYHPDDDFAAAHFDGSLGKTEAWIVIDIAHGATGVAWLGFSRAVGEHELAAWVRGQNVPDMLGAMNRVELSRGDTLLVPAGSPHAIGPGLTLVELQQPTDLSILLEYTGYNGLSEADAFLGLGLETALSGLDRRGWDAHRLDVLTSRRAAAATGEVERLFPAAADRFFRAERLTVTESASTESASTESASTESASLEPGFSVLIVLEGAGVLGYQGGSIRIARGMTVLTPHGAGELEVTGTLTLLRCRPPRA